MLPPWLEVGLAASLALAGLFALLFALGERLFPSAPVAPGEDRGESRRRREIRAYLDAIGEDYVEDRAVDGFRVAFYLPERDVAITFDARAYFRLDGGPTHVVLVEHEMPGTHLGARLPFEVPDLGSEGGRAPGGSATGRGGDLAGNPGADDPTGAFAVLGLDPGASRREVTAAYREKVKEAHPDHGGDRERFHRVREAYAAARERAR